MPNDGFGDNWSILQEQDGGAIPHDCGINSTLLLCRDTYRLWRDRWHDFYPFMSKTIFMSDLLLLFGIWLGTYLCSMGLTVILFRVFFPLKAKEQWQQQEQVTMTRSIADRPGMSNRRAVTVALLNRSRHLA